MAKIAFVTHPVREEPRRLAKDAAAWLAGLGHDAVLADGARDAGDVGGADLVVSIGGDGTILHSVELVAPAGVPILGVNSGRLGYLTAVEPPELRNALERWLAGDFVIEERMTLAVTIDAPSNGLTGERVALNEAVVEKTSSGHTVHVAVCIDGTRFTTYAADGLIVATPTGSTAYAFSVRGPILAPSLRAMLLTPVSPHMLFDRSLVLEAEVTVRLEVIDDRPAVLTVDGQEMGRLAQGDAIECSQGPHPARFVTFGERDFYRILKAKFGLADR
jgi:NAD+ kinase